MFHLFRIPNIYYAFQFQCLNITNKLLSSFKEWTCYCNIIISVVYNCAKRKKIQLIPIFFQRNVSIEAYK